MPQAESSICEVGTKDIVARIDDGSFVEYPLLSYQARSYRLSDMPYFKDPRLRTIFCFRSFIFTFPFFYFLT